MLQCYSPHYRLDMSQHKNPLAASAVATDDLVVDNPGNQYGVVITQVTNMVSLITQVTNMVSLITQVTNMVKQDWRLLRKGIVSLI